MVTGANRGIGFEIVRQCIARADRVVGTYRDEDRSRKLLELANRMPERVTAVKLDVRSGDSIAACFSRVSKAFDGLDILFNNSGVGADSLDMGSPETHNMLGRLDGAGILQVLAVNSVAPVLLTQRFLPLLEEGDDPRVVNITSQMGSIQNRTSGGCYSYCASKAALNMFSRVLAHDLKPRGIICIAIHPGWARTDMGGPEAPVGAKESVSGILRVVGGLRMRDSGRFLDYQGQELPW
jgi:NAD(P)-dependent dehydrogenase (short-subunit alcohol dehydrogenase family)